MPSMNRPTFRGVSTSREQSTMQYLTEGFTQLERSATILRQNLSNYLADTNPQREDPLDNRLIVNNTASETNTTIEIPDTDILTREVDQILKKNDDLKFRVKEVIEANATFKEDMKSYLEDNAKWKEEFIEETRKIEMDLQAVLVYRIVQSRASDTGGGSLDISCGLRNKLKTWYSVVDTYGRNTLSSLKQQWNEFEIADVVFQQMMNNPYNTNSYFDIGLTH